MSTCPRCQAPLPPGVYEGATVETCTRCGGQWLGREELKQIVDTRERTWEPGALEAMRGVSVRGLDLARVREDLACPDCAAVMEPFQYGGDSGIILDRCLACGGIWLDGGELEKVQMAVEAAELDLGRDAKRFAGDLRRVEVREDAREQREGLPGRAPLVSAIANRVVDVE